MSRLKATKRLISAISALVASLILCIGVCLAWFASNGKTDANGLNSEIRSTNIDSFTVTACSFSKREVAEDGAVTYTVEGASDGVMAPYGNIEGSVTALLLKFDCKFLDDLGKAYELGAAFSKTIKDSVQSSTKAGYDLECNLSEVVEFFAADLTGEITEGKTVTQGKQISFTETDTKVNLNGEKVNDGKGTTYTFYCIVDYGETLIQNKYAYALNNIEGCSLNSQMSFENDMSFFVEEA